MRESEIERYFVWAVQSLGGVTYKFRSPTQRGVADRIACMPNGETWFVAGVLRRFKSCLHWTCDGWSSDTPASGPKKGWTNGQPQSRKEK